jgi:hypothetical protein
MDVKYLPPESSRGFLGLFIVAEAMMCAVALDLLFGGGSGLVSGSRKSSPAQGQGRYNGDDDVTSGYCNLMWSGMADEVRVTDSRTIEKARTTSRHFRSQAVFRLSPLTERRSSREREC